jgi:lipooligosaccharide transport system ATP-binding protein
MSTHYIEEAERLADTVAVMSHGRIVALGRPEEVVRAEAGEQALEVYGTPEHLESVTRRAGEAGWRTRRSGPAVVIVRAEQLAGEAPDGVRRPANLEDAFVMLTGEQIE